MMSLEHSKKVRSCEVLIVGAGPAGSTCATFLSSAGINCILLDKETFPRDKPCGGGLTTRIFKRFDLNNEEVVDSVVRGGHLYGPDLKSSVKVDDNNNPVGYMVLRSSFDNYLVEKAKKFGSTLIESQNITEISFLQDKVLTKLENGEIISSKIIIGADGVLGIVAKKSGLKERWKDDELGLCVFIEQALDAQVIKKYNPDNYSVHIHIEFKDLFGYFWLFYKKHHVNIGLGCLLSEKKKKKVNLKLAFLDYLKHLEETNLIPKLDISSLKLRGGLVPLKKPIEQTYGNRILLLGDSAGFVNPLSGEGIYYAMSSGENAAKTIIQLKKQNKDYVKKNLKLYEKTWKNDFGGELSKILFVRRFIMVSATINNLINYAKKDAAFRELIMKFMLGMEEIQKRTLAKFFIKHVLKDLFRKFKQVMFLDVLLIVKLLNKFYSAIPSILFGKKYKNFHRKFPLYLSNPEELSVSIQYSRKKTGKNSMYLVIEIIKQRIGNLLENFRLRINKKL
ncbi:MAG: NAD(P)/FAD-dependent oxidoreductase [Candidatus Lokiarchaeota archaeon]|nr:NAD(P)/FAD-dependent oxidoreductase [Candidatus Lokiarchaeota archaeon]